jgi:hypothetical protein
VLDLLALIIGKNSASFMNIKRYTLLILRYSDHYLYGREELTCTDECTLDMETRCLDTSCSILVECDYQQSATCYRSYVR